MTKTILVSCLAASFLLSGAAIAPTWAASDPATSVRTLFADGEQTEEAAPQEEQGSEDRDSYLINSQPTFDLAQSEEGEAAEPKPEEGGEGGGGD